MSERVNEKIICDFCCSRKDPAIWKYPARTFTIVHKIPGMTVNNTSHDNWAACDPCRELIMNNLRAGLVQRSLKMFFANEGVNVLDVSENIVSIIRQSIQELQDGFFNNRLGECSLISWD